MDWIINLIIDNKEWVFSGIGIPILYGVLKFFFGKRKSAAVVQQRAGNNAVNINASGDVHYDASRKN